ncbi:MAG TPA: hypothetical protein VET85_01120 [Stellaceae bacterium]|nr:hypothetical protein [Stellaceae bacterium]
MWAAACTLVASPGMTQTQYPGGELCGLYINQAPPELVPVLRGRLSGPASDASFGCMAWQSFIYLNWPVLSHAAGEPDPNAPFGKAGPTVWETFMRHDAVFRAGAEPPPPWGTPDLTLGEPRRLTTFHQAGGGMLIDRAGKPVYYEMLIDRDEYNYIVANKLYDAEAQLTFAQKSGIVLPAGPTPQYGEIGTIELKAAWKILTPDELAQRPVRFHIARAILEDGSPAVVGLVGFHLNQRVEGFTQGLWATFAQIDSAPAEGTTSRDHVYLFHDPDCTACIVNAMTDPPQGTQVERKYPVAPSVRDINVYVRDLVRRADPDSPWQFYELLGVQWPQFALGAPSPLPDPYRGAGRGVPLSIGMPSTQTLVNPVIETFHQVDNVSCLGCHATGATAKSGPSGPLAADYSFLLGHAKSRPKDVP